MSVNEASPTIPPSSEISPTVPDSQVNNGLLQVNRRGAIGKFIRDAVSAGTDLAVATNPSLQPILEGVGNVSSSEFGYQPEGVQISEATRVPAPTFPGRGAPPIDRTPPVSRPPERVSRRGFLRKAVEVTAGVTAAAAVLVGGKVALDAYNAANGKRPAPTGQPGSVGGPDSTASLAPTPTATPSPTAAPTPAGTTIPGIGQGEGIHPIDSPKPTSTPNTLPSAPPGQGIEGAGDLLILKGLDKILGNWINGQELPSKKLFRYADDKTPVPLNILDGERKLLPDTQYNFQGLILGSQIVPDAKGNPHGIVYIGFSSAHIDPKTGRHQNYFRPFNLGRTDKPNFHSFYSYGRNLAQGSTPRNPSIAETVFLLNENAGRTVLFPLFGGLNGKTRTDTAATAPFDVFEYNDQCQYTGNFFKSSLRALRERSYDIAKDRAVNTGINERVTVLDPKTSPYLSNIEVNNGFGND